MTKTPLIALAFVMVVFRDCCHPCRRHSGQDAVILNVMVVIVIVFGVVAMVVVSCSSLWRLSSLPLLPLFGVVMNVRVSVRAVLPCHHRLLLLLLPAGPPACPAPQQMLLPAHPPTRMPALEIARSWPASLPAGP
jgi:hypothetical protein